MEWLPNFLGGDKFVAFPAPVVRCWKYISQIFVWPKMSSHSALNANQEAASWCRAWHSLSSEVAAVQCLRVWRGAQLCPYVNKKILVLKKKKPHSQRGSKLLCIFLLRHRQLVPFSPTYQNSHQQKCLCQSCVRSILLSSPISISQFPNFKSTSVGNDEESLTRSDQGFTIEDVVWLIYK